MKQPRSWMQAEVTFARSVLLSHFPLQVDNKSPSNWMNPLTALATAFLKLTSMCLAGPKKAAFNMPRTIEPLDKEFQQANSQPDSASMYIPVSQASTDYYP